jgi:hypothetical protein
LLSSVIAGLDPAIQGQRWMPGSSPGMTEGKERERKHSEGYI